MPTQAQSDAAYTAARAVAQRDIEAEESKLNVFIKPRVEQAIEEHRAQIDAVVREMMDAGLAAAEKA